MLQTQANTFYFYKLFICVTQPQDTQRELAELVNKQDSMVSTERCSEGGLLFTMRQVGFRVLGVLGFWFFGLGAFDG